MHELVILGRLALWGRPMHGYLIAKIIGKIMGPFRQISWGALYPILNRLEQEGLVTAEECGPEGDGRVRKAYLITDAGRARLHELLLDTERHLGEYDRLFAQKVALFWFLQPEERLYLARHYAVYTQQNLDHLDRSLREYGEEPAVQAYAPEQRAGVLEVIAHRRAYWEAERNWAEELIRRQTLVKEAS